MTPSVPHNLHLPDPEPDSPVPLAEETRIQLQLAVPAILSGLAGLAMGTVDTLMVGRLGPVALSGVALANSLYFAAVVLFTGVLAAVTPLVARDRGAGEETRARRWPVQAAWLALAASAVLLPFFLDASPLLVRLGQAPEVAEAASAYLATRCLALIPGSLSWTLRGWLYGMGNTRAVTVVVLAANVLNAALNQVLIHGALGSSGLGVSGAGLATALAELAILAGLVLSARTARGCGGLPVPERPDPILLRELTAMGLPIALQLFLETSVFSIFSVVAGWLGAHALSAHHVALTLAGMSFMVAAGFSTSGSVRVAELVGRGRQGAAHQAGLVAIGLGLSGPAAMGLVFLGFPTSMAALFTDDPSVLGSCVAVLGVASIFQLFDGLQVIAAGCLRGYGDTRTALWATLVGYWVLGLPLGAALALRAGLGLSGLWWGLTLALAAVGVSLTHRFATWPVPAQAGSP